MENLNLLIQPPQNVFFLHERLLTLNPQFNINNTQSKTLPTTQDIWIHHSGNTPRYVDNEGKVPEGYEHQCAINMSYALQMAGVDMSSFRGKTVTIAVAGRKLKLALDIYQLATWAINWYGKGSITTGNKNYRSGMKWDPEKTSNFDKLLGEYFLGQTGIIIIYDHWINKFGSLRGHIDIWNGTIMKRGNVNYFLSATHATLLPLK